MGNASSGTRGAVVGCFVAAVALTILLLTPISAVATSVPDPRTLELQSIQQEFGVSREAAERNLVVQERGAGIVEELQATEGAGYAGVWFDGDAGEFVIPVVRSSARNAVTDLLGGTSLRDDYRTRLVSSSWRDLEVSQERLDKALSGFFEERLVQTSLDPRTNSVVIYGAAGANKIQQARIESLAAAESVNVEVRPQDAEHFEAQTLACDITEAVCDKPLRGGVFIEPSGPSTEPTCTTGFKAIGNVVGNRFMLTAGHCFTASADWNTWDTNFNDRYVGHIEAGVYPVHDYAAIRVNGYGNWWEEGGAPWPSEVVYWGGSQHIPITSESWSYLGQSVCHSGWATKSSCGTVSAIAKTVTYGGAHPGTVYNLTEVSGPEFVAGPGDSGGPFWTANTALGLLSGGSIENPHLAYYNEITEATTALGVTVGPRVGSPPPPPPPLPEEVAYSDAANANSTTTWQFDSKAGWQQLFMWGHEVAAGTRPAMLKYGGTTHIFYVDASRGNQITEWSWNSVTGWQQKFLATDPVAAGSSPSAVMSNGTPHIYFSDAATGRSIAALVYNSSNGTWKQSRFYGDPVAKNSSPSAIATPGGVQIFFADAAKNNTIAAWTWSSTLQQSFFYGDPVAANSSPSAVVTGGGASRVYFADAAKNNTIAAWTWSSTLQQSFFYGDPVAANSSPSAIETPGSSRVFFADAAKNNTIAAWTWNSALQQSFFYGDSVAANTSPAAVLTGSGNSRVYFNDSTTNNTMSFWEWGGTLQQTRLFGHPMTAGSSPGT